MPYNFSEFYIKSPQNPKFNDKKIIEDDLIQLVITKLEMILFTNKGDVFGSPRFGADLYRLLWTTNVSADFVKNEIIDQINTYIPEIREQNYYLNCYFMQDQFDGSDILFIDFRISEFEVNVFFN